MTENLNSEMMAAMQESLVKGANKTEEPAKVEEPVKVEPPKTEEPVKVEPAKVETPKTEEPAKVETPVVQKSFEEEFLARFDNKFKSVDEIKSLLEKPQVEFADENIAHWNELAKKGIKIDREFIELQSMDFESIDDPTDAIFEKWKRSEEGRGLSDDIIRHEISKKYSVEEWIEKDEADLTLDDKANRARMMRDGEVDRDWLINYKNERVLEKQPDPKALEAMAKEAEIMHNNWEKFVESDLVNKITKFNVPVNDKGETFDFEISEQDRKEVGEIMKALPKDTNAFFGQFIETDDKGNQKRNHAALYQLILKGKNFDKAIALATRDAASKEALRLENEAKNTNFSPGQTAGDSKQYATLAEAQAAAVQAKKI